MENLIFDVLIFQNYENVEFVFQSWMSGHDQKWPNLVSRGDVDKSVFATKTLGGRKNYILKKLTIENLTKVEDRCYLYVNNVWRPENDFRFFKFEEMLLTDNMSKLEKKNFSGPKQNRFEKVENWKSHKMWGRVLSLFQ